MNKETTGGPAFPVAGYQGMTLRDHFAGLAMQSLILKSTGDDNEIVDAAEDAYSIADAMLEARNTWT